LFTGTQKLVDTEGRIDKFYKKAKQTEEKKKVVESYKAKREKTVIVNKPVEQKSLKDMLKQIKDDEQKNTSEEAKPAEETKETQE